MSIIEDAISELEENKRRRESGETITIPWDLPRLSGVLPGIAQGRYTICSANAKVGKTMLTDFLYLYQPLEWLIKHPESKIKLKIFYFSLEMTRKAKVHAAISYKLNKDYGIIVSPEKLKSLFQNYTLDDKILTIIKSPEFMKWLNFIEEHVEFIDEIRHGYGIFNVIKAYAESNGHYTTKTIDWVDDWGQIEKRTVRDKYIPNNPNEFVIVITDHISLLQPSKEEKTLHAAIMNFSSIYALEMRDKWGYIPVVVQQQSASSEQQQFTYKGDTIVEKLKPSPDYLADNRLTSRDCDLMIGLFWPNRYDIEEYNDWDLTKIGKYHRELLILLNRHGTSNASIDMYMNGATNYFRELPKEPRKEVYDYIQKQEEVERNLLIK